MLCYKVKIGKRNFSWEVRNMCNIRLISSVIGFMKTSALFQNLCWSAHRLVYKPTKLQICKQWTLATSKNFRFQRIRIEVVGNWLFLKFIWKSECLMFCCVLSCRFSWFSLRVIYTVFSLTGTLFITCLCVVRFFKYGHNFEETLSPVFLNFTQVWEFYLK
jgi:hypothetical protein